MKPSLPRNVFLLSCPDEVFPPFINGEELAECTPHLAPNKKNIGKAIEVLCNNARSYQDDINFTAKILELLKTCETTDINEVAYAAYRTINISETGSYLNLAASHYLYRFCKNIINTTSPYEYEEYEEYEHLIEGCINALIDAIENMPKEYQNLTTDIFLSFSKDCFSYNPQLCITAIASALQHTEDKERALIIADFLADMCEEIAEVDPEFCLLYIIDPLKTIPEENSQYMAMVQTWITAINEIFEEDPDEAIAHAGKYQELRISGSFSNIVEEEILEMQKVLLERHLSPALTLVK